MPQVKLSTFKNFRFFFSNNINPATKDQISSLLDVSECIGIGKYLGESTIFTHDICMMSPKIRDHLLSICSLHMSDT